ncbi:MAG TPA: peroxiredoxin-like family protein [Candidatus Binatia bacterium]
MPCQAHLGEVSDNKSEFDRRGIRILAVSFVEPSKLAEYQERHPWPFPVLADPERKAYQTFALPRFNVWRVFSPSTVKLYRQLIRRGMKRDRYDGADIFQSGGDFLLNRDGKILYAHRSKDPADRPTVGTLLQQIDHLG